MSVSNSSSWRSAVVVLALLLFAWLCLALSMWIPKWSCLGPPYLYVTFHHEEKGVRKYSRDGCFLSSNVLTGHHHHHRIKEARDVQLATYKGQKSLYVVQAMSSYSSIPIFGNCDSAGKRKYITTGPSIKKTMGLNHPYALAFDDLGNLYVSCQHTNTVLRFEKDTFEPLPLPPKLQHIPIIDEKTAGPDVVPSLSTALFRGTFYQYEIYPKLEKKHHNHQYPMYKNDEMASKEGVRGIAFVEENLWIACEDTRGVSVVNPDGMEIERIHVGKGLRPVGILYDRNRTGLVFVSTKGKTLGPVKAIDAKTKMVVKEYSVEGQKHATGLLVYNDMLYVACQELGSILTFDLHTTKFLGVVASNFPDTIERMELSDC